MVFAAKGGIRNGAEGAVPPQWNGTSYLPRAEPSTRPGGVSRSRTEPWQPRAEWPGGWLNPHARKGVSTFGNTGKHRPEPGPDSDRATGAWAAGPYMVHICSRYAPRRLPSGVTAGTSMPAMRLPSSEMAMFCSGPAVWKRQMRLPSARFTASAPWAL